jgi:hypothetical protein
MVVLSDEHGLVNQGRDRDANNVAQSEEFGQPGDHPAREAALDRVDELHHLGAARSVTVALADRGRHS